MLTDQQIEAAARKLCELRGIDPDFSYLVTVADAPVGGQLKLHEETRTHWQCVADEIRAADQLREAIASVSIVAGGAMIGPCACGHLFVAHSIKGVVHGQETLGCTYCDCFDYVPA